MNLFIRNPSGIDRRAMAHQILDDARAGLPVTLSRITWALRITGDLT